LGSTGRLGSLNGLDGLELGSVAVEREVPVGGVMGVNEGVAGLFLDLLSDGCGCTCGQWNACAWCGCGSNTGRLGSLNGLDGLELGSVAVESEVPVGGVMGVNEGVAGLFLDLLSDGCGGTCRQWNACAWCGCRGNTSGCGCRGRVCGCVFSGDFGVEGSRILTCGLNMISFQDFEPVDSS